MNYPLRLTQIAELINARYEGDQDVVVRRLASLRDAGPDDLTFYANSDYANDARATAARAVITSEQLAADLPPTVNRIYHPDPEDAIATVLEFIVAQTKPHGGAIHHTSSIAPSSTIAKSARIGAGTIIGEHCVIGEDVEIGINVVIEDHVTIGQGTTIESGAIIRWGTVIGNCCRIGSGAVIGSEGFGYIERNGQYRRLYHLGNVIVGDYVEIGANTCVDRAMLGQTVIATGTKIDNLVHIAHNVTIGEHSALAAQVGIAGSTHIGKHNRIGGQAGITGHVSTCDHVTIGAQSGVSKSITIPGEYSGTPAVELYRRLRSEAALRRLVELAPILESLVQKFAPKHTDQLRDEQE